MIKEADRKSYLAALCRAVPYHLVERVLENPTDEALAPQLFTGSVLAVDVVNFTARIDALSRLGEAPLQLFIAQLDMLLSRLQLEALFPFEGLVVEFAGDGLNVVFRGDGFVERAAAAAMKVHEVVKTMPVTDFGDRHALQVRCGIATGPITLTCVGDLSRRVTLCTGETVHRAHRVQPIAPPGQTALDAETKRQLSSASTTLLRDDVSQLDGISAPVALKPIVSLGARIDEQIEEKISLLEPFVSAPLAARLRTTPQGWRIEPELRRCVVVFAEVVGLEDAGRPRREIWAMIRSVFRSFQKYDGLVLKVTTTALGHQLMAVFGIHSPSENDAEKALLASLEAMTRFSGFRREGDEMAMKLGVHSGQVLFGAIGSASKHDLTAMGDVVNIAARAMKAAQPMEVVATDDIVNATGAFFMVSSLGAKRFKGKSQGVGLHRIHGSIPGRAHYARRRALRRFSSGRDDLMVKLRDLTDRALAGEGALVGIVGGPGTGKSHLLSEAIDKWIEGGGTALVGRCQYALQATPFGPIRQFFDAFLGVGPNASEAVRNKSLRDRLYAYSLGSHSAELIALLQPVHRPDGINEAMFDFSAPAARERLINTVMQFTARRLEETQVMYVLEDLHFADTLTLEFVKRLAAMPKGRPYLFIATTRPDPVVAEVRKAFESEFVLENLSSEDSVKLTCHELNCSGVDGALSQFLSRRTQGNPDFLVQVIRFLSDRALISVVDGVAHTVSVDSLEALVPPTWAQVTLARLDGLTEIERRVLRTASAIGVSFSTRVIEGVEREIPVETIHGAVDNLEKRELVLSDVTADEYRFHDEMTRTIAYSIIPEEDRRRVHQRIAQVLQQWTSREDLGAVIAHHLEKAGNLTEALAWFSKMVIRTAQRGLLQESQYFEQRLERLRKMLG